MLEAGRKGLEEMTVTGNDTAQAAPCRCLQLPEWRPLWKRLPGKVLQIV